MPLTSAQRNKIQRQFEETDWNFSGYIPQRSTSIHSVHWYPAVFFKNLVVTALDFLTDGPPSTFVDPFAGSGVAPLEAWLRGWQAKCCDTNSMAIEIIKSKCDLISNADHFSTTLPIVVESARDHFARPERPDADAHPQHAELARLFASPTLRDILALDEWTRSSDPRLEGWRPLLQTIVSSLLHKPYSLFRDVNHSYIIDRSRAKPPRSPESEVLPAFEASLAHAVTAGWSARREAEARIGTLPAMPQVFGSQADGLVAELKPWNVAITSPPYFGMNDYTRSGYITRALRDDQTFEEDLSLEIGPRRLRTSRREVTRYLDGLESVFGALRASAADDALLMVVIGQSDSRVATDEDVLARSLKSVMSAGFESVWRGTRRVMYRKINSTPYRSEEIWVMTPGKGG